MDDKMIIALYNARSEKAISATNEKYGKYCFTVADNILKCEQDSLECVKGEFEVKTDGMINLIKQLDMEEKACKAEAEIWKKKADVRSNGIKRIKKLILDAMVATDMTELTSEKHTIKVVNNGGVEPITITGEVPESMTKVILEPDKDKIRNYLKTHDDCSFAKLEPRGKHLTIK